VWLSFINSYILIFRMHYLVQCNKRYHHERANSAYGPLVYWVAEHITVNLGVLVFVPGVTIAYFMMGLPAVGAARAGAHWQLT
jgi:hypothetical protein